MSPFTGMGAALSGLRWGWKAAGAFLAGLAVAIPAVCSIYQAPIVANAQAIEIERARVDAVIASAADNTQKYDLLSSKLDRMLCNQNPDKSWDQCELEYGNGWH